MNNGSVITESLRRTLSNPEIKDTKIPNNKKEEKGELTMDPNAKRNSKKKTNTEEVVETKVEETVTNEGAPETPATPEEPKTPETPKTPEVSDEQKTPAEPEAPKEPEAPADDVQNALQQALQQAQKEKQANDAGNDSGVEKTTHFQTNKASGTDTSDLSEEEAKNAAQKEAEDLEKAKKKAEMADKIRAFNSNIQSRHAEIKTKTAGVDDLTDEQKTFQALCQANFRVIGLLAENGPEPVIGISRTFPQQNKKKIARPGASAADISSYETDPKNSKIKKGDIYKFETRLTNTYKGPRKLVGAVISYPQKLAVTPDNFRTGNFQVPTASELSSDAIVTIPVSVEVLYIYGSVYCDRMIYEDDSINEGRYANNGKLAALTCNLVTVNRSVNGVETSHEEKQIKPNNRSALFVQENTIPIRTVVTTNMHSANTQTIEAISASLLKKLGCAKDEQNAWVDALDEVSASLLPVTRSEKDDNIITSVAPTFFTNGVQLGSDKYANLGQTHWSNITRNPGDGKVSQEALAVQQVAKYNKSISKKDGKPTYHKDIRVLGKVPGDPSKITLQELAAQGFKAAQRVAELGVTEAQILECYTAFKAQEKLINAQKPKKNTDPNKVSRVSAVVDADVQVKAILGSLTGNANVDLGFNMKSAKASMSKALASAGRA